MKINTYVFDLRMILLGALPKSALKKLTYRPMINLPSLHTRLCTILNAVATALLVILFTGCTGEPDFCDPVPSTTLQKSGGNKINKPKLSEENEIPCSYSGGSLHLRFQDFNGIYRLNVRDADTGQSTSYRVDSSQGDIIIPIGEHSAISLELNTGEAIYTGQLKRY